MTITIEENLAKERMLVWLCREILQGISEQGGDNQGYWVKRFQRTVDGKATGEPWCMAMVQFALRAVDQAVNEIAQQSLRPCELPKTEHCMTLWRASTAFHVEHLHPGCLAIWQHYDKNGNATEAGHVGVVIDLLPSDAFLTIEGNTGGGAGIEREGDSVMLKRRPRGNVGRMHLVGFVSPYRRA